MVGSLAFVDSSNCSHWHTGVFVYCPVPTLKSIDTLPFCWYNERMTFHNLITIIDEFFRGNKKDIFKKRTPLIPSGKYKNVMSVNGEVRRIKGPYKLAKDEKLCP